MTDTMRSLVVLLDRDMREDDVEYVKQAIKMIRCVSQVLDGEHLTSRTYMDRDAALHEFIMLNYKFLGLFGSFQGKEGEERLRRVKEILGASK